MRSSARPLRRTFALLSLATLLLLVPARPAHALQGVVNGVPSPSWQTNGTVFGLAYANGVIYVGGDFTSVRPPGAPLGTGEVPRNHLAAFEANTGDLLPFNPDLDGTVSALAASPDGATVYAGGDFTSVGGVPAAHLAAFDTATGAQDTVWAASADDGVRALETYGNTVYVGGIFSSVDGRPRARLAAVTADTGALSPSWLPKADRTVSAISIAKDGSKVFIGGSFQTFNGAAIHAIAAADPATGATLPFPAASAVPPVSSSCKSAVKDLTTDADSLYVAAEGSGGGCFDGTFSAWVADGTLKWRNACLGATQAVEVIGNYVYKGSHAHDCSAVPGGFPELLGGHYRLMAENVSDGLLGPWYPAASGETLGPRVFATDGQQLFVGGDFHTINDQPQQSFARFGPAPDITPPVKPAVPKVSSVKPGTVKIVDGASWDRDDDNLTYTLKRDGVPIKSWVVSEKAWDIPTIVEEDTGLVPGSTHTYKLEVTDGTNSVKSPSSPVVTVAGATAPYRDQVRADLPFFYWRLGELSGTTAADASGNGRTGVYGGGITRNQAGAIAGDSDRAVFLDGSTGRVSASTSTKNPQKFTAELWFRTNTTRGGKLIGFGSSQTGVSSRYDRHVYMTNAGKLIFGVYPGTYTAAHTVTISSAGSYNDDNWHLLDATLGPNGMALYVDGAPVGTDPTTTAESFAGYWRVGGDNLSSWPSRPTSDFFRGTIDEAAVYGYALTAQQVADRYASAF